MVYDLTERTKQFGKEIIRLCKQLPKTSIINPLVNQIIRSGTSVGANYAEANGASSKKDFRNKIFICKKECIETKYWIEMLIEADTNNSNKIHLEELLKEAHELTLIFSKIAKNSGPN